MIPNADFGSTLFLARFAFALVFWEARTKRMDLDRKYTEGGRQREDVIVVTSVTRALWLPDGASASCASAAASPSVDFHKLNSSSFTQ